MQQGGVIVTLAKPFFRALGVAAAVSASAPAFADGGEAQCRGNPAAWNGCVGSHSYRDGEYSGTWRNGKRDGRGTFVFANGDSYSGDFSNDRMTGSGTYVTASGDRYAGKFRDGQRDGYFIITRANGERSVASYRNGAPVANLPGAAADARIAESLASGAPAAGLGASSRRARADLAAASALGRDAQGYTDGAQESGGPGTVGTNARSRRTAPRYAPQTSGLSPGAEPARAAAGPRDSGPATSSRTSASQPSAVAASAHVAPTARPQLSAAPSGAKPAVFEAALPTAQRKVALVIGNSAYKHANPLANPKNDAADMARLLKSLGFTVVSGTDLDYKGMGQTIRAFLAEAEKADVSLFFYAGHGIQVSGRNYLIPVDAAVQDTSAIDFELVNIDAVTGHMGGANKVGIVLLDACRNNPFTNSLTRSMGTRSVQVDKGLAQISSQAGGLLVAFATAPGDVAADGKAGRNSPFTTALLEQLPAPGVEIELIMKRVKAGVIAETNNSQRPWHNSDLASEVYLTRKN